MAKSAPTVKAGFDFKGFSGKRGQKKQISLRKGSTADAKAAMASIVSNYNMLINNLNGATPDIIMNAMQPVFDKSQEYCPVDTSALIASGIVFLETDAQNRPKVTIQYGDEDAWYAALVHESVWLNHAPPTRAKFLQNAMEEEIDQFITSMAVDYAMIVGGG